MKEGKGARGVEWVGIHDENFFAIVPVHLESTSRQV
jgi:hypothetical protein